jgi:4-hydroxy-tetrahydrodipicolinate synthase
MFNAIYTAIVSPFHHGKIDADALRRLVRAQISAGVDGIVAVGTTGETATLNYEEQQKPPLDTHSLATTRP